MKTLIGAVLVLIVIGGAILLYEKHDADTGGITATSTQATFPVSTTTPSGAATSTGSAPRGGAVAAADIKVTSPQSGAAVSSPLTVAGQARGSWFFEAVAPVYLADASGHKIAEGQIRATGDWMTTNFVPFTGTLTWSTLPAGTSTAARLVFMNDNPSGDPSLQKSVAVPVTLVR